MDLGAADKALTEGFSTWLKQERDFRPAAFKKRSRKALNRGVGDEHIKSWSNYHVLAVFDLDFYAEVFEIDRLSHEALCETVHPGYGGMGGGNYKEWGRSARKMAKAAFDSVSDLFAQTAGKG